MTVTMAMARMSAGNTSSTSMRRMMKVSQRPPTNPAMAPRTAPMRIATPTVRKPMNSEMRVP